jgi:hypothetical protein
MAGIGFLRELSRMKFHYFDVELYMKLILQTARSKIKKDMLWVVRVMIERIYISDLMLAV